jgi:hypothetical protein
MNSTNTAFATLGILNEAINALNLALSRAAELNIPLELWASSSPKTKVNVKCWQVRLT